MPSQKTDPATIEGEKETIRRVVGLTDAHEIVLNDRGWDSRVYSFQEGRFFFKFPRSEKIQGRYAYEIAAIKFMATLKTDIKAQKILWEHPENAYFGYEGVQGDPVGELIRTFSVDQKRSLGSMLGGFLKQFHGLKLAGARQVTVEDEAGQIQRWYENSSMVIADRFTKREQERLHELVHIVWPTRLRELGSDPVLSHGDLHFENILYGPTGALGIIDFGDVAYYDRSKDFLELVDEKVIFDRVLAAYGSYDDHLLEKVALRKDMIQIITLGFHFGKGDTVNIDRSVEKIRALLEIDL